jgi:hypothetical protein
VRDKRWEFGASIESEVSGRTVDDGEWAFWEFQAWDGAPEVEAVLSGVVKEFQGVFQSVVVGLGWAGI